jgi:hypothetical protein
MSELHNEIFILNSKIDRCSKLYCSLNTNFSIKKYFDYDLFGCHGFLDDFFDATSDNLIIVNYLNMDICEIVKNIYIDTQSIQRNQNELLKIRTEHMSLYGCSIEGSYYLSGDTNSWFIFYDAQSDTGILMTDSEKIVANMADYLYSPHF